MTDSTVTGTTGPSRTARIAALEPPYDEHTATMLARWMPPGADAPPLALFRTLARHEELFSRMRPLGAGILGHGRVEPRLRELAIHRTCVRTGAEYEWGVHAVAFGAPLGLTREQLRSTVHGSPADPCWSAVEQAVLRLADELHDTSTVSDETFTALRDHFFDDRIIELVVTCGWYHTIAYVINAARIPLEPWAARFPS